MKKYLLYLIISTSLVGCDQSEWLDVKSNKSDVVPTTLEDYQALLNDYETINCNGPALGVVASDNYYTTDAIWTSVDEYDRNSYIWASHISESSKDWTLNYKALAVTNIVLEGIEKFATSDNALYQHMKGTALFFRALYFFNLVQEYAKPYEETTASTDYGIVLKLTAEVDEPVKRSSVEETYSQIIRDLNESLKLLPTETTIPTKPTKNTTIAFLGKVFFYMEKYDRALEYLEKALETQNELLDFNTLNASAAFPFPTMQIGHKEVIFYERTAAAASLTTISRRLISKDFYELYEDNDLRKVLYFNPTNPNAIRFKGFYTGLNSQDFSGIATNEIYLTLAECYVREGNSIEALVLLNKLLKSRYKTNTFFDVKVTNDELLRKILLERNKELPFTGNIRWMDLRRLNKDPRFAITLSRTVNGDTYTLPPNDNRYVFPLPFNEIQINGLQQNER